MTTRLRLLALVAAATLAAPSANAQSHVQAGRGSVSTAVRVGLVIPPRLRFRVAGQTRLQQLGDTATYAMDVEVAANLAWTLNAVPAGSDEAPQLLRVKDEQGEWRTLRAGEPMVALAADQQPSNWRAVRVEVQVIGARGPRALPAILLDLQPAQR